MSITSLPSIALDKNDRELLKQGAESKVYKIILDSKCIIEKERIAKPWRHPILDDKLRKQRMKQEMTCLLKAANGGVAVPELLYVDKSTFSIYIEFIEGSTLRSVLESGIWTVKQTIQKLGELGSMIAKLHDLGIIHEDLTTSNILVKKNSELMLIDFGLSHVSISTEDKAVDIYVLERAFISTHPLLEQELVHFLHGYMEASSKSLEIMKKLTEGNYYEFK